MALQLITFIEKEKIKFVDMTQSKSDQSFMDQVSKMFEDVIPKELFDWKSDMKNNFGVYIPAVNIVEKSRNF